MCDRRKQTELGIPIPSLTFTTYLVYIQHLACHSLASFIAENYNLSYVFFEVAGVTYNNAGEKYKGICHHIAIINTSSF
jgi:hypothetical protein